MKRYGYFGSLVMAALLAAPAPAQYPQGYPPPGYGAHQPGYPGYPPPYPPGYGAQPGGQGGLKGEPITRLPPKKRLDPRLPQGPYVVVVPTDQPGKDGQGAVEPAGLRGREGTGAVERVGLRRRTRQADPHLPPPALPPGDAVEGGPCDSCTGGACAGEPCAPAVPCPPPPPTPYTPPGFCVYGGAEFLYYWFNQSAIPPLLATGPGGTPGATTLVNDDLGVVMDSGRLGGRFTLGGYLDPSNLVGVEGTFMFFGPRTGEYALASSGPLVLPYTDAVTGAPAGQVLAAPGVQTGVFRLKEHTEFWSGEANVRAELWRSPFCHVDGLIGGRAVNLRDDLTIYQSTTYVAGPAAGVVLNRQDRFGADNMIYGGQLGLYGAVYAGRWFADAWGKVLLANNHQEVGIRGSTEITGPAANAGVFPGGLYAQPTNIGNQERDLFTVMPAGGVNVGYEFGPRIRMKAGYNFFYISRVAQPGQQIDTVVNAAQQATPDAAPVVGEPFRPQPAIHDGDFWAHGVSGGVEFRY